MRPRRPTLPSAAGCLLALMLGVGAPAPAQHPNHAQGFRPEHVFDLSGLENVDLFNGNLTLTIPIGGSYPVGPELSYGLTLTWTGNVWQWEERPALEGNSYLQAEPRSASRTSAGLGWELSLGRLLDAADPANSHGGASYQGPDQALHALGSAGTSPDVVRSRDGTYLRHTQSEDKVESPDGTVRLFGAHGLTRLEDPFGNGLTIAYQNLDAQGDPRLWQITDDHGRIQKVFLTRRSGRLVVTRVELTNFQGGAPSVYTFSYSDSSADPFVPRACNEPVTALFCTGPGNACGNTSNVQLPILTRVTLPDGSAYSMPLANYRLSETGACPNSRRILNGQLERLELPTGGALEWDWDVWGFPQESRHHGGVRQGNVPPGLVFTRSAGLAARRHVQRNGQTLGSWTYDQTLHQAPGTLRFTESRTEVTDPLGHRNVHFFSVYHDDFEPSTEEPPGWDRHEYGLPFTKRVSDGTSPGRFLSQEVHGSGGAHLRSVFVRYERDGNSPDNPRMASQRTVYHDDAGRRAHLDLSSFDGLGHYRQAVATGNFPGVATRTTFTNWNPNGAPADGAPWVLDTYDLRQVTQGSETVTQELWFRNDGFLRRTRTRKAAACGMEDVVVVRVPFSDPGDDPNQRGYVRREDIYGGDGASLPCGDLGSVDLPSQPEYRTRHTYSCGVLSKTEWLEPGSGPLSFLPLDRTIDCSTGLASSSRDVSGLETSFLYDDMGRLTDEIPGAGEAKTVYTYTPESASSRAKVAIRRKAPNDTVLSGGQVELDGFGRVEREVRDLPGGGQAERTSSWTARGDLFARTEWHAPNTVTGTTGFSQIDPFGRPRRIFLPDGFQIDIDYDGVGGREIAVPVATGISAGGEPTFTTATTTETYDRFGRLLRLTEPNGTRTSYAYDAQGNLTRVEMNDTGTPTQVRTFAYDHRGFLTSESHPELGTSVLYSDYDALGNPRRLRRGGWDLAYTYDPAGRLTEIRERGTSRVWKEWEYATGSEAGAWGKGKLASAIRHNRVFFPGTISEIEVPVTEDYEYSGVGGRISEVTTTVGVGVEGDTRPVFDYDLVYDALGNVTSRTQPRCDFNFCSSSGSTANPSRTVTGTFTQGLLTAVPGYASSITYHPNGLVNQVTHTNGVTDLQERDPADMARPARLRTSGASEDFDTGVYAWDGAGNVTKMGNFRFAYDLLSRVEEAEMSLPREAPCVAVLLLQSGTETGTVTRESCGTVQAQGTYGVGSTGNVTLRAGHRVVLGDGFSVASGGRLTAGTDPTLDPGDAVGQSYDYDRFGNLLEVATSREGHADQTRTIGTVSSTNRLSVATYDLSGNVTSWAGRQYRWDAFNMLTQERPTAGNGHTFLYGPGDERVWTIDWTAGADPANWLETWTLRDLDGTVLRQLQAAGGNNSSASWSFHRDFVYRNASLLAAHTPQGVRHFHLDHLGSPRLVTDSSGDRLAQHLYFPFGEEATDPAQDSHVLRFTGHERDDLDSGGTTADLDYQHARFYSPHLSRYFSFDPLGGNQVNPQTWNRYAYTLGNPLKYTDPLGLFPFEAVGQIGQDLLQCLAHGGCDFIEVTGEDPGYDPLTGVSGYFDVVQGSAFTLGFSGALGGGGLGGARDFELSFSERVLSSIPTGLAQTTGDAVVGFGDTLSFGLTDLYRTEVGLSHTINEGSGAYVTGQVAGVAHGLALGGAGAVRASASTRLFGRNTFMNTGRRLRIGHSGHKNKTYFSIRGELVDRAARGKNVHIDLWRINRPR